MKATIIVVVIVVICIIFINNHFIVLKKSVERSKSLIDVYLKKRYDLIPNLIEIVKEYSRNEIDLLTRLSETRSNSMDGKNLDNDDLEKNYNNIIITIEKYPELKSNNNYLKLQNELTNIENEIAASRRILTIDITEYNNYVESFLFSIVALVFSHKLIEYEKYFDKKSE